MSHTPRAGRGNYRHLISLGLCLTAAALCSCRGRGGQPYGDMARSPYAWPPVAAVGGPAIAPPMSGPPMAGAPQVINGGELASAEPRGPWQPPGTSGPWPEDEYLRDGGDTNLKVSIGGQWRVSGLDMEDTVAHYETLDGKTRVEPSNQVHIYAPRFGAVRQVTSLLSDEQVAGSSGVHAPQKLTRYEDTTKFGTAKQNLQPLADAGARPATILRTKQGDGVVSTSTTAKGFHDGYLPYENFTVIRQGVMESAEMAALARGVQAALAWSHNQAVQVVIDNQRAMAAVSNQKVDILFTVNEPPANPKLRLVKVASTQFAEPGDTVDFTIRFDNVGNQLIGNVTILDSLNTRLEYVPESAQCSVDAKFVFEPNEGDSVVVRCEITDPIKPGEGGVLRFQCKVR